MATRTIRYLSLLIAALFEWICIISVQPSSPSSRFGGTTKRSAVVVAAAYQDNNNNIMRAWHCHGRNQRELVERLRQAGICKSPQVKQVLEQVDRQYYVPQAPYLDAPQAIGLGQTISAPHMHAHVLEEILPHLPTATTTTGDLKFLDVGCGSGYLTACLGRWLQSRPSPSSQAPPPPILGRSGKVFGIDIYPPLVEFTKENLRRNDSDLLQNIIQVKVANGWKGLPEKAPFDAIHVGAAAAEFPHELAMQLTVGGVLIVPVGPNGGVQNLYKVVRKRNNNHFRQDDFEVKELLGVRYVPLVQQPGTSN